MDFSARTAAGAFVAVLATAALASACGMTVRPTVSANAAAVLAGRSAGSLILRLEGVKGSGLVRIYVADGTLAPYTGTSDARYVAYGAFEAGGTPRTSTIVVSGVEALRKAAKNGALELRFVGEHGEVTVGDAVLDTGS